MNGRRIIAVVALLTLALPQAGAKPVSCPAVAPAEWLRPNARLEEVRILSFLTDQPQAEGEALPIMAPFNEWKKGGVLYQTWNMNFDTPRFKYQVDCLYHGTERYVRLDAPDVKQCVLKDIIRKKVISLECK